jgi:hypothetical protein
MKKVYVFLLALNTLSTLPLGAQRLEKFSEGKTEFISQLHTFMTASKTKAMEETYKEFEGTFKGGIYSEDEVQLIMSTGNAMLGQRMAANPYFHQYLRALTRVKSADTDGRRFREWHGVLEQLLGDIDNRRLGPFENFVRFSVDFFEHGALRYSQSGTSWFAPVDQSEFGYDEEQGPFVAFKRLDLVASRKQDSILIQNTSGKFFPSSQIWKGDGGKVTWARFGWDNDIYVELPAYEFELKSGLYEVKNARLHYPLFLGSKVVEGNFSDKLVVENAVTGSSFPRFESYDKVLELANIGPGIKYSGGLRLAGATIYGYGTRERKALIRIFDEKEKLVFRAASEQFTIRREERIAGEGAEVIFYFGRDSIYHPSVNIRFDIPKKEMQLSRGSRGRDRNPFFSSIHNINVDAETIYAYLDRDSVVIGKPTIDYVAKPDIYFESLKFFDPNEYYRLQNIASVNPIAVMKAVAEKEGNNFIDANLVAKQLNPRFTIENIQSLIYDLVAKGFINYQNDKQVIEVKDKVFHYADAAQGKVDYDVLRIRSATDSTNAVLNLETNHIEINGVRNIEFSRQQKVALIPEEGRVTMMKDRDMDFSGKLFAGFSSLEGKGFHFDYDKFQIGLDSIRYFDLFVPSGQVDKNGNPIAHGVTSRIEHLSGVLLVDAPSNKSGREDIPMFPSLQSKEKSFVFYDYSGTQDSVYLRDSFYFQLDPFSYNQLDNFTAKDIRFNGKFVASNIFPDFRETLVLQPHDYSLGFSTNTPEKGYPAYQGKGQYKGKIQLSNSGLLGKGNLQYLGASVNSEDFIFRPSQTLGSAKAFDLEEDRGGSIQVPQVRGGNVDLNWRPYKDSMYVKPRERPFALFKENNHTLDGTLILTPGGLKGDGFLDWDKANMRSKYFSFGAFSVEADTTEIGIKASNTKELALSTKNVHGFVDFEKQAASFEANDVFLETTLPYNQYQTSMNEFDWHIKDETINFQSKQGQLGSFLSIHPDQDSLRFNGETAFYDLKTNELKIGGVPHIISADAFVYPDSGLVDIQPGGVMTTLNNARIVADTLSKHHVINRATVRILGRKEYRANGFYEYNIGERQQEIEFAEITGTRVGKGARSEKQVATRATGTVKESDKFYIDHKTEFRGAISLKSESRNLYFEGFARLDAEKLPHRHWFAVSSEGDKQDLAIRFNSPKSFDGEPLETGLFLSKESAQVYPRVLMPLHFRKDRPIFPVKGVMKYDQKRNEFIFGDTSKVLLNQARGNIFVFNNSNSSIQAEGRFQLGSGLKYVKLDGAGRAATAFPPVVDPNIMTDEDSDLSNTPSVMPTTFDLMAGIQLIIPEKLMKILITDLQSSAFDAKGINYLVEPDFYKKAATELFADNREVKDAIDGIVTGFLDIPKKYNPYTFVFAPVNMKWDADYQSLVNTDPQKVGLVSINGDPFHKHLTCYLEFKMPSNEDDRLYIYLKTSSDIFYFFGYRQGILNITSNNNRFMDELFGLKSKDLVVKMSDGETYEIQPVEPSDAQLFVRRMQAVSR